MTVSSGPTIGIYGASGFGREVMPLARQQFGHSRLFVFIDDNATDTAVNGHPVYDYATFCGLAGEKAAVIAIADSGIRQRLDKRLASDGIPILGIRSTTTQVGDACSVGEGAIFCGFTQMTSNIVIGRHFHCNFYSYVAHDCVIGDFVTFAPGVRCNGNIHIGDGAYIGSGAMIRQGRPGQPRLIGAGAVIGLGAVVLGDVAPGETVVGNPARPLRR